MLRVRNVLVPVDTTNLSEYVLDGALTVAERFGAKLRVLFVRRDAALPHLDDQEVDITRAGLVELVERRRKDGHALPADWISVELRTGEVNEAILQAMEEDSVDFVVMGTHGRKGIADWFRGSTAEQVVQAAKVPVLIMKERTEADEAELVP